MFDTTLKILLDLILDNYKCIENKIDQLFKAIVIEVPKKNLTQSKHPTWSASKVEDCIVEAHADVSGVQSINSKVQTFASI